MSLPSLKISSSHRYLTTEDGTPFFWLADTAWELLAQLTAEEIDRYFSIRQEQGFNVVQVTILSENAHLEIPNAYGRVALCKNDQGEYDPSMPDLSGEYSYFDHTDKMLDLAEKHGIYVALLPTWGDKINKKWGFGPEVFTPENAREYGRFLGARYKDRTNLIWVMGGDRPMETGRHVDIQRALAFGIREGGAGQLMTYHPMGGQSSGDQFHEENWLDFNMLQSGHWEPATKTAEMIRKDWDRYPVKPTLDGECNYEDHPIQFNPENGYFDATDVRRASYHAVFSGSLGITYGHHCVWPMKKQNAVADNEHTSKPGYFMKGLWEALKAPCAGQIHHLKDLFLKYDLLDRVPCPEILKSRYTGANLQVACQTDRMIAVYCPAGLPCTLDLRHWTTPFSVRWFDPRTGIQTDAGEKECGGADDRFQFQNQGRNCDMVLLLERTV